MIYVEASDDVIVEWQKLVTFTYSLKKKKLLIISEVVLEWA